MRALFTIALLLITELCFSYTVVLKTGEKIEGNLLSQDEKLIAIKDASGKIQTIEKSLVDLATTEKLNPAKKVFTNQDLEHKYGRSVHAPPQTQTEPEAQSHPTEQLADTEDWLEEKERISEPWLRKLEDVIAKRDEAASKCVYIYGMYDTFGYPVPESGRPLNPYACAQAEQYQAQLEDLKEQARVAGVPVQWIQNVAPDE